MPKHVADKIFYLGMRELQVPRWKCAVIYLAVTFFGKAAWKKNAKLKQRARVEFSANYQTGGPLGAVEAW